jgi:hypothetical protein
VLSLYVGGIVALAITIAPLWWVGARLRAVLVPSWRGGPARLAEAITALSGLVALSELLGLVHLFRRLPLAIGAVAVAALVWRLVPEAPAGEPDGPSRPANTPIREPLPIRVATWLAVAGTSAAWAMVTAQTINRGMNEFDTVIYHLPSAATFVQTASLSGIHYNGRDFASAFGPLSVEVFHAVGMLAFGRDTLSPLLNLAWLALAFLAAWCLGRPSGRPHLSLLGVTAMLGTPLMIHAEAGTAKNDLAVVVLLVAIGALLLQPEVAPSGRWLVAMTAGLLLGTKLTALVPVVLLAIGMIALTPSGKRLVESGRWAVGLTSGAFWYLRDWISVGSPIPDAHLAVGPLKLASVDEGSYGKLGVTLAHYLNDPSIWRTYLWPELRVSLGWGAVFVIPLALGGFLSVLRSGPAPRRLLSLVGLTFVAIYLVTPFSAMGLPGTPTLFGQGLRFVIPALALGLGLLATQTSGIWSMGLAAVLSFSLVLAEFQGGAESVWPGQPTHDVPLSMLAAMMLCGAALAARRWSSLRRVAVVSLVVAAVPLGFLLQRRYLAHRYVNAPFSSANAFRWARTVHHARIGIVGFSSEYPLYGLDLTNHVHYLGLEHAQLALPDFPTCQSLRTHLEQFHYDFVVVAPQLNGEPPPPETQWLLNDPGLKLVDRSGASSIFEVTGIPDPTTCA